jgi:hypothetical protein
MTDSPIGKVDVSRLSPYWIGGTVADPGEAVLGACGQSSLMPHCQHASRFREEGVKSVANILAAYFLKSGEYAVVGLSRVRRSLQSADTNVVLTRAAFT